MTTEMNRYVVQFEVVAAMEWKEIAAWAQAVQERELNPMDRRYVFVQSIKVNNGGGR